MHRDIKPANCLINIEDSNDEYALLSDFGFAVRLSPNELIQDNIGTPGYKAPEVLLNKFHSHKVDSWSLGVMLFFLMKQPLDYT